MTEIGELTSAEVYTPKFNVGLDPLQKTHSFGLGFAHKNNTHYQKEVLAGFIDNLDSPATKDTYKMELELFFDFLKKHHKTPPRDFSDLRRDHGTAYKAYLTEQNKSASTVRKKFSVISSFCKYLAEAMILDRDIMYGIKRPPLKLDPELHRRVTAYQVFASDEIERMFSSLDGASYNHAQYKAILAVALYTGFRNQEVAKLKVGDISFDGSYHFITAIIKRGKSAKLVLHPNVMPYIAEHLEKLKELGFDLNDEHYLFPSLKPKKNAPYSRSGMHRLVCKIFKMAGIDTINEQKLSFHSLRATVATHLHNRGVPLEEIQKQLFHSRPETTKLYCREMVDYSKSSVFSICY